MQVFHQSPLALEGWRQDPTWGLKLLFLFSPLRAGGGGISHQGVALPASLLPPSAAEKPHTPLLRGPTSGAPGLLQTPLLLLACKRCSWNPRRDWLLMGEGGSFLPLPSNCKALGCPSKEG